LIEHQKKFKGKENLILNHMSDLEKEAIIQQVELALDDIRPHLIVDGGNVSIVELTDDMTVRVKWLGACETCSMSAMTMKAGVEQAVRTRLPQILAVEAVNSLHD
jgi:Fe-S cluster biogenesis protein NfuA